MKGLRWLKIGLGLTFLMALASCGSSSQVLEVLPEQLASVPGLEAAGPMPEYHLSLVLDATSRRLVGKQTVTIPNRTGIELGEIIFRLYPNLAQYRGSLRVGPVWINNERGTSSLRAENTSLVVPLPQPLGPDASTTISMTFDVDIPQRDDGYTLFGLSKGIWSLPDAYPLLAVHNGVQWHEALAPAFGDAVFAGVGIYDVSLTLPQTLTLAATGSVVGEPSQSEGERTYHITGGPLREFAWLASADYRTSQTIAEGTVIRSYYLPEDESAGQAALHSAAASIRAYGDAFGPYPFPEMNVVQAPLEYYGMEYPGLNLIGTELYRDYRKELEDRIAHEMAHQWWYTQVGSDQINTPWLDEGLAEYSTATYYLQVYGQARANRLINQRWLVPYLTAVENGQDAVVNQPSAAFGSQYEVIVYGKAALFFDAVRQEVGYDTYLDILRAYTERYRWKIATPDDFLRVGEEICGQDLDGLYSHWIMSKQ